MAQYGRGSSNSYKQERPNKSTKTAHPHGKPGGQKKNAVAKQPLLLEARPDWHGHMVPSIEVPQTMRPASMKVIENVQNHARQLLVEEVARYETSHLQASSSYKFMSTIMNSGTWSDKVSALTLVVQESPLHTLKHLENLINLAGKQSRTQALMAVAALKDLFGMGSVLPSDRKLRTFSKQPELLAALQNISPKWTSEDRLPEGLQARHLVLWVFEDRLKELYFELLKILEKWCNDEVEYSRNRAVGFIWELLKEKPEQEENLLRLLVNKLGDKSKKVASKASHLILQLQTTHPQMKMIITSTIESDILLRSSQSLHAKYYAVITLNQTVLRSSSPETANKLLDVYFSLFVSILNSQRAGAGPKRPPPTIGKKRKRPVSQDKSSTDNSEAVDAELENKIVAQILTGINRAFPFSEKMSDSIETHLDTMFRITHSANFNTSIQALVLIQRICSSIHSSVGLDRYMRTLYESVLDPRLIKSSKQTIYLNLLYRSLKEDPSLRRVQAFVKRLLQVISLHEPPFIVSVLYLISELCKAFPSLMQMINTPELSSSYGSGNVNGDSGGGGGDDDVEVFRDVPNENEASTEVTTDQLKTAAFTSSVPASSEVHKGPRYDPRKRDPSHSSAHLTALWELIPQSVHYHPSVAIFANSLLYFAIPAEGLENSSKRLSSRKRSATAELVIPPKPDPSTHTLIHFLDRFIYKNPKASASSSSTGSSERGVRGTSLMQPALASTNTTDSLFVAGSGSEVGIGLSSVGAHGRAGAGRSSAAVNLNSAAFWTRPETQVKPEEVFFHRYFNALPAAKKKSRIEHEQERASHKERFDADDSDSEEVDVDAFDDQDLSDDFDDAFDGDQSKSKRKRKRKGEGESEFGAGFGDGEDSEEEAEIWKAMVGSQPDIEPDNASEGFDSDGLEGLEGLRGVDGDDLEDDGLEGEGEGADELDLDDDDAEPMVLDEDEDGSALFSDEDETPPSLAFPGAFADEDVDADADADAAADAEEKGPNSGKVGIKGKETGREKKRRKRLRDLPTFASVDDYAALIDQDADEDLS